MPCIRRHNKTSVGGTRLFPILLDSLCTYMFCLYKQIHTHPEFLCISSNFSLSYEPMIYVVLYEKL